MPGSADLPSGGPHSPGDAGGPVVLVVDVANVVGSIPNGWWRDRVGATQRLLGRVSQLAGRDCPPTVSPVQPSASHQTTDDPTAADLGLTDTPSASGSAASPPTDQPTAEARCQVARIVAVIEGQAKAAEDVPGIDVIRAAGSGDDSIVTWCTDHATTDHPLPVVAVTSDKPLRARLPVGTTVVGAGWLTRWLDDVAPARR